MDEAEHVVTGGKAAPLRWIVRGSSDDPKAAWARERLAAIADPEKARALKLVTRKSSLVLADSALIEK